MCNQNGKFRCLRFCSRCEIEHNFINFMTDYDGDTMRFTSLLFCHKKYHFNLMSYTVHDGAKRHQASIFFFQFFATNRHTGHKFKNSTVNHQPSSSFSSSIRKRFHFIRNISIIMVVFVVKFCPALYAHHQYGWYIWRDAEEAPMVAIQWRIVQLIVVRHLNL